MSEVTQQAVSFPSEGATLKGILFLPEHLSGRLPGIVVTGTWTSVKEQMANRYAERLAAEGFATLSFDFRGYGESEGQPRDFESPDMKVEDIHNAFSFLQTRPEVDPDQLGALGICASAGYTLVNTVGDARVKSLAVVAPWLHNGEMVRALYGGDAGVAERIRLAKAARMTFEQTGTVEYVPAVSETDPMAAMPFHLDFYMNKDRGAIPQWPNRFAPMAWTGWLTFDPIRFGRDIAVPLQVVHSEAAATPDGVKALYALVNSQKDIVWTEGEQTDFYDLEPQVTIAIQAVARHFGRTLQSNAPVRMTPRSQ